MSWTVVEHDGVHRRVAVVRTAAGTWVGWAGGALFVSRGREGAARADDGDDALVAPMTGRVVQVRVAPGQQVEIDEVLVVLEAMKMEYRLKAPRAGTVASVSCRAGELVELGVTLVAIT